MIGAVIAMQSEADILLRNMKSHRSLTVSGKQIHVGTAYGKEVCVCVCGVGKVNAALGAQLLISKFDAEILLNFGVAGGLNASTKLCEVYQIGAAVQFDFDLTQLNGTKIGTLDEETENYLPLQPLPLAFPVRNLGTSDRFNDSVADYKLLTEELGADIREMEGAAIGHVCYMSGVDFVIIRCISDNASGEAEMEYPEMVSRAAVKSQALVEAMIAEV